MALARLGNDQLSERRRRRERRPGVLPGEPLTEALRRMAIAQADLALRELTGAQRELTGPQAELTATQGEDLGRALHEARKAIKRLRTAVRLLERELGSARGASEHEALRRAARGLSGTRDAEVLLATLDALIKRHPRRLGRSKGTTRMRRRLAEQCEAARRRLVEDPTMLADAIAELRAFRARAAGWPLGARDGTAIAESALRRIYGQGRRRRARAAKAGSRRRTRAMHRWRKRVKDLRYAAEMLEHVQPRARALAKVARRADKLGERLGEEHDLAVLGEWVRANGKHAGARRPARRRLLKAIDRRRRRLRLRALDDGGRLYRRGAGDFVARVRRVYERDERRVS